MQKEKATEIINQPKVVIIAPGKASFHFIFLDGAKDGIKVVFNIFPTLVGLFVAIGALRSSGIIDLITNFLTPFLNIVNFPTEILPLALIRPISGSSSIAVATDIM